MAGINLDVLSQTQNAFPVLQCQHLVGMREIGDRPHSRNVTVAREKRSLAHLPCHTIGAMSRRVDGLGIDILERRTNPRNEAL